MYALLLAFQLGSPHAVFVAFVFLGGVGVVVRKRIDGSALVEVAVESAKLVLVLTSGDLPRFGTGPEWVLVLVCILVEEVLRSRVGVERIASTAMASCAGAVGIAVVAACICRQFAHVLARPRTVARLLIVASKSAGSSLVFAHLLYVSGHPV